VMRQQREEEEKKKYEKRGGEGCITTRILGIWWLVVEERGEAPWSKLPPPRQGSDVLVLIRGTDHVACISRRPTWILGEKMCRMQYHSITSPWPGVHLTSLEFLVMGKTRGGLIRMTMVLCMCVCHGLWFSVIFGSRSL